MPSRSPYLVRSLGVLSFLVSFPFAFMVFVMGVFASDSGTSAALAVSYAVIGFALLYPILALVCAIIAWRRNSLVLAVLPLLLPLLLLFWILVPFA